MLRVGGLPVNILPKTNSLGGRSFFGVVVLVIVALEGSISASLIVDAASTFTAYDLEAAHATEAILEEVCFEKAPWGRN